MRRDNITNLPLAVLELVQPGGSGRSSSAAGAATGAVGLMGVLGLIGLIGVLTDTDEAVDSLRLKAIPASVRICSSRCLISSSICA